MNFLDVRLPDLFWSKAVPEPNSGCWLWTGATDKDGYARYRHSDRITQGHRVTFSVEHAIDPTLVLDHYKCRTPSCVNPAHVEQVPQRINTQRNYRSTRTHCSQGHAFDNVNTYRTPNGRSRKCRRCHADRQAARKARLNARSTK